VVTLYFYWKDCAPVVRSWPFVPRIGDTIVLPDLGGNLNGLKVYDVVCEGYDEPSISIYLRDVRTDRDGGVQRPSRDGEAEVTDCAP
jgi:hypothetical protein